MKGTGYKVQGAGCNLKKAEAKAKGVCDYWCVEKFTIVA